MVPRRARWVALVTGVVVAAAGCGGGGTPANEWVADVCEGMTSWVGELGRGSENLNDDIDSLERNDFVGLKELTVAFVDRAVDATEVLLDRIEEAGVPAVDDGADVADTFLTAIGEVRDVFADVRDGIAGLPTDDPRALARGLEGFAAAIGENTAAAAEVLEEARAAGLGGPELAEAFEEEPACEEAA